MSNTRRANPDLCMTRLGIKASPETRKKISEALKRIGHRPPHTTESIEKMRQSKIGNKILRNSNHKTHVKSNWCIVNGTIYSSPAVACSFEGICKTTLYAVLRGVSRSSQFSAEYGELSLNVTCHKQSKPLQKPLTIDGVSYSSLRSAARALNISYSKLRSSYL